MPNQRAIKERIEGIKGTQKVTKAMKLIATIKLKQVQTLLNSAKAYQREFLLLFLEIASGLTEKRIQTSLAKELFWEGRASFPAVSGHRKDSKKKEILLVLSSDRGLCGAYNLQIFKALENYLEKSSNQRIELVTVGKKAQKFASTYLQKKYSYLKILKSFSQLPANPKISEAREIFEYLEKVFRSFQAEEGQKNLKLKIIFSSFQSRLSSKVEIKQINSLDSLLEKIGAAKNLEKEKLKKLEEREKREIREIISPESSLLLFEPSPEKLLPQFFRKFLLEEIFCSLLSAKTSELSYRVNSMTNATENAEELIKELTVTYNKARQSSITQEIIEIVSGSES